jgi:hypothetical protein
MKRAGGAFDDSDNAQSAVDETAHIIVAAEVLSTNSDLHQLAPVLNAVKANTKADPKQVLADAGYRSEEELAKLATKKPEIELVIVLGQEGRQQAKPIDTDRYPHTVDAGQVADRQGQEGLPQTQMDCRATQGLGKERAGLKAIEHAGDRQGKGRVQARLLVPEFTKNGGDAGKLRKESGDKEAPQATLQTQSGTPYWRIGKIQARTVIGLFS